MKARIDDAEWKFRPLPDSEVGGCLEYELWREAAKAVPQFVPRLQCVRLRLQKGETCDDLLFPENFVPSEIRALSHWLEYFPDTPFLKIPRQRRKDLPSFEARTQPLACIHADWPITLTDRALRADDHFASFVINWDFKDDKIVQAFKDWLKDSRPKDRPGRATTDLKLARASLNQLAAYRLSREKPALDAITYTEDKCGKALFDSAQSWSRAKAQAKTLIEKFADRARR